VQPRALGRKVSDEYAVPLCRTHHREVHRQGDEAGSFEAEGHTIFFKIDYLDQNLKYHSPDPTDPVVTVRVITVMLADEY
jgi:hypothetical protein